MLDLTFDETKSWNFRMHIYVINNPDQTAVLYPAGLPVYLSCRQHAPLCHGEKAVDIICLVSTNILVYVLIYQKLIWMGKQIWLSWEIETDVNGKRLRTIPADHQSEIPRLLASVSSYCQEDSNSHSWTQRMFVQLHSGEAGGPQWRFHGIWHSEWIKRSGEVRH